MTFWVREHLIAKKMSFHYDIIIPCDTPEHTFENEVMQGGDGGPLEAAVETLSLPFTSTKLDNGFRHLLFQITTKCPTPRGFSIYSFCNPPQISD